MRLTLGGKAQVPAIGDAEDGSLLICAIDLHTGVFQPGYDLLIRIAVLVLSAHGDHGVLWGNGLQKGGAGGAAAAVMPQLQHRGGQGESSQEHILLGLLLRIGSQQKRGAAVIHPQDDTAVVDHRIGPSGAENSQTHRPKRKHLAHMGTPQAFVLRRSRAAKIPKGAAVIGAGGAKHLPRRKGSQYRGQPAGVILMGVGADHIVQLADVLRLQIAHHLIAGLAAAAIHQNGVVVIAQQGAVRLSHIQKMHLQRAADPGVVRRGGLSSAAAQT